MQTLFKGIVDSLSTPGGDASATAAIDGVTFDSGTAEAWSSRDLSAEVQAGWRSFRDQLDLTRKTEQLVDLSKSTGQLMSKGFTVASEKINLVIDDVSASLQPAEVAVVPEPPPGHPFAVLPWENARQRLERPPLATEEELRAAVKYSLCQVSRDASWLEVPPPADFEFEFDPWRQHFAEAMRVIDSELARLRFELVPKRLRDHDFWLMYFCQVEREALPNLPLTIEKSLTAIRSEPPTREARARQAAERVAAFKRRNEYEAQPNVVEKVRDAIMDPLPPVEPQDVDDEELEEFEAMLQKGV